MLENNHVFLKCPISVLNILAQVIKPSFSNFFGREIFNKVRRVEQFLGNLIPISLSLSSKLKQNVLNDVSKKFIFAFLPLNFL